MDKSGIFKACNIIAIVIGGLNVLVCLVLLGAMFFASSGLDQVTQGGVTFFTTLVLLFPIAVGVTSILAGKAGLQSDPDRCRKCSRICLIISILSLLSAFSNGSNLFFPILETAFYGIYTYLAYTEFY